MLKLAGAAYLIWIGYKALRSSLSAGAGAIAWDDKSERSLAIAARTTLISLSNPKSVLFLSAVFPTFLDPALPMARQFATMFCIIICVVGTVHFSYAFVALKMRSRLVTEAGRRWTSRLSELSFVGIGSGLFVEALRSR